MKLITVFYTVLTLWAVKVCGENYQNVATNQLNSIKELLNTLKSLKSSVQFQLTIVCKTLFDFDLDSTVKQLEDFINKNINEKGIDECKKMYENDLATMNQQLQNKAWDQMTILFMQIQNFTDVLECIQNELSGTGFDSNVKACEASQGKCQITDSFAADITNAHNYVAVQTTNIGPYGLAKRIIEQMGAEAKSKIISDVVLTPVIQCLEAHPFLPVPKDLKSKVKPIPQKGKQRTVSN